MTISSFRIQGYKSIRDSGEIAVVPGVTIVVGRNNAGKSALLEGIVLRNSSPHTAHRTVTTHTTAQTRLSDEQAVTLSFVLSTERLRDLLGRAPDAFFVPRSPDMRQEQAARKVTQSLQKGWKVTVTVTFSGGSRRVSSDVDAIPKSTAKFSACFDKASMTITELGVAGGPITDFVDWLGQTLVGEIYTFKAERLNVATGGFAHGDTLESDARNLAVVLHTLQTTNPARFTRLVEAVRAIFPDVQAITVMPTRNNTLVISVWDVDLATERSDLARPLSECGTGLGQVLAMLYVAINSDSPRTILIDEPQSFLHPGAARKLMELLRGYSQHQFIVATHLPAILSAARPDLILKVDKQDHETRISPIDEQGIDGLRTVLADLGVRLADVFGMDRILWVEGKTEEACFPVILGDAMGETPGSTAILAVSDTGGLNGKDSKRVLDLYKKLSGQPALLPPTVAFLLDRERRSSEACEELKKRSGGLVHFLNRRMYENYLLDPQAIAELLTASSSEPCSAEQVTQIIAEEEGKHSGREASLRDVDGAQLLSDIWWHLAKAPYDKVAHGLALTRKLTERAPNDLQEVRDQLRELLMRTDVGFD